MVGWIEKNLGTLLVILAVVDLYLALLSMVEPGVFAYLAGTGFLTVVLLVVQVTRRKADIAMFLSGRAAGYGANVVFFVLAGLGILVLINLFSHGHHKRFDLTAGGTYTLSPQTRRMLEKMDRDVRMTVIIRQSDPGAEKLRNFLDEYTYHAPRLTIEFVDPDKQPRVTETFLERFGAFDHGSVFVESAEQTAQFKGIGEQDPMTGTPVIATEEEITNGIVKVLQDQVRKIGFLTGHGERSLDNDEPNGYSLAGEALGRLRCTTQPVSLADSPKVPEELDALVVAGPTGGLLEHEKRALQAFVDAGKGLLVMIDPMTAPGLDDLLAQWGVSMADDVVVTDDELLRLMGADPFVTVGSAAGEHGITKDLTNLNTYYPLARSVSLQEDLPEGVEGWVLLRSVPRSWAEVDYKAETVVFDEGKDIAGPVSIAAALTVERGAPDAPASPAPAQTQASKGEGDLQATENGAGTRETQNAVEQDATGEQPPQPSQAQPPAGARKPSRIVIFGDADFASNGWYHTSGDANGNTFLNAVSWLTEQGDLVAIPPRSKAARTLQLTGRQSKLAFLLAFFLLPMAALIAGVTIWRRRKSL